MKEGECNFCFGWKEIQRCDNCSAYSCAECALGKTQTLDTPKVLIKCGECSWNVCKNCYVIESIVFIACEEEK